MTGTRLSRWSSGEVPEFSVGLFSFLLNFVWEFLQVPAYDGIPHATHWDGVLVCLSATVGDVGLALTAFWMTSLAARSRFWLLDPKLSQISFFVAVGLGLTVVLEYFHTKISGRWQYSEVMPLVPWIGTGILPLLQWALIPLAVIWLARRHIIGARRLS
jgi:hypothetical protein